jgi:hypothetical protein
VLEKQALFIVGTYRDNSSIIAMKPDMVSWVGGIELLLEE